MNVRQLIDNLESLAQMWGDDIEVIVNNRQIWGVGKYHPYIEIMADYNLPEVREE